MIEIVLTQETNKRVLDNFRDMIIRESRKCKDKRVFKICCSMIIKDYVKYGTTEKELRTFINRVCK